MILEFEPPEHDDELCFPTESEVEFATQHNLNVDVIHRFNDFYLDFLQEHLLAKVKK